MAAVVDGSAADEDASATADEAADEEASSADDAALDDDCCAGEQPNMLAAPSRSHSARETALHEIAASYRMLFRILHEPLLLVLSPKRPFSNTRLG